MKYKVKRNTGIQCIFENKKGERTSCFIPKKDVLYLLEDIAYETIQKPNCDSSSCAVNNFCECDPINEDMELIDFDVSIDETIDMKSWFKKYFNEIWTNIDTDIDFSKYEPVSTNNSLHIHEEKYVIGDNTYRLLYNISDKSNTPLIQILQND